MPILSVSNGKYTRIFESGSHLLVNLLGRTKAAKFQLVVISYEVSKISFPVATITPGDDKT